MKLAALQSAVAARFPSALPQHVRPAAECVSSGVAEVDALTGGLPRGSLIEVCGPACSGRSSLLLAMLAAAGERGEVCALVDASDQFDPHAAHAAGVDLQGLLWVRCANLQQAFRAAELLLQGGGFGMVAMDLGGIAPQSVHRVPLNVWFRFLRAVEHTPAILTVLERQPHARTCASLVLELHAEESRWESMSEAKGPPHANLLRGLQIRAQVMRTRRVGHAETIAACFALAM